MKLGKKDNYIKSFVSMAAINAANLVQVLKRIWGSTELSPNADILVWIKLKKEMQ